MLQSRLPAGAEPEPAVDAKVSIPTVGNIGGSTRVPRTESTSLPATQLLPSLCSGGASFHRAFDIHRGPGDGGTGNMTRVGCCRSMKIVFLAGNVAVYCGSPRPS